MTGSKAPVPEEERPGETKVWRNPCLNGGPLLSSFDDNITTLYESFNASVKAYGIPRSTIEYIPCSLVGDKPFLGSRTIVGDIALNYKFESYEKVAARVRNFAYPVIHQIHCPLLCICRAGLAILGTKTKSNIGILSINRPEWKIADYACMTNNYISVPLYDTLNLEALEHICIQTDMKLIITEVKKLPVLEELRDRLPKLCYIVIMDNAVPAETLKRLRNVGYNVWLMANLEKRGSQLPNFQANPPKPDDVFTICFTSGTTGPPKGAMITHANAIASISSALFIFKAHTKLKNPSPGVQLIPGQECHISYLPLAHIFERIMFASLIVIGTRIGFYQGDLTKLLDDVQALKPTVFVSVPRLLNRLHSRILSSVDSKGGFAKWLFLAALKTKMKRCEELDLHTHWLWDRLVFNKVKAQLGGEVKVFVTGAAPIVRQIFNNLRVMLCADAYEGYGLTECTAVGAITRKRVDIPGKVGLISPSLELKLVDVPDMDYYSTDKPFARGEICLRGPSIFSGYYMNEEMTSEVIRDGWFHTGDIGMLDDIGRMGIIDRKKVIFKLAQGEYISPEFIESVLLRCPLIAQIWVTGNPVTAFPVAVIIPDEYALAAWAKNQNISGSIRELCSNQEVLEMYLKELSKYGRHGTKELRGFQVPQKIHLHWEPFSQDNGLMTPTFKLKRTQLAIKYSTIISKMINSLGTA